MQGLSAAEEVFEKNWYPCFRRALHGSDSIDPKRFERFLQRVLRRLDKGQPPVPNITLAFQDRLEVIE